MQAIAEESAIIQKTRELCQTLLDQPDVQSMRQRIDAFVADDRAKTQYDTLMTKGQALQQKQQLGTPLSNDEITDFEKHREAFVSNPVAKGFLDAQEEMNQLQQSLGNYVTKTFELGRVPGPEDFDAGSCGHGCGCHH